MHRLAACALPLAAALLASRAAAQAPCRGLGEFHLYFGLPDPP